jgi:ketosteroid isomerase-like protein
MSEEEIGLLQRAIEAFNRRDLHALSQLTTDDFEFVPYLTTLIEKTTYSGHKGWVKYFSEADTAWKWVHARLDDVQEVGAGVLRGSGEIEAEGRASGLDVHIPLFWMVEIRDGKLARMQAHASEADAAKAAEASQLTHI